MLIKAIHKIERDPKQQPASVMPGEVAMLTAKEARYVIEVGAAVEATEEEAKLHKLRASRDEALVVNSVTADQIDAGSITAQSGKHAKEAGKKGSKKGAATDANAGDDEGGNGDGDGENTETTTTTGSGDGNETIV